MHTKLTLRLEESLIRRAKAYARRRRTSVSSVVADFFALMDEADPSDESALAPRTRSLLGALAESEVDEAEYRRNLERRHA